VIDAVTVALLVAVAFGGYFLGGVANNVAAGESVARMFGGSRTEQAIQLLVAAALVYVASGVIL
jgi:hypothetical protein